MLTFTPAVRLLESNDAGMYLDFLNELDSQSMFMHYDVGERTMTEQGMRSRIKKQQKQGNSFVIVALGIDDLPIGYFSVNGGNSRSTSHSATVAVGVLEKYRGQGVAFDLFSKACTTALEVGITRFECTVVKDNRVACNFWMRNGFRLVGYLRQRFCIRQSYLDELVLENLLVSME